MHHKCYVVAWILLHLRMRHREVVQVLLYLTNGIHLLKQTQVIVQSVEQLIPRMIPQP